MKFQSSQLGHESQIIERLCREIVSFANTSGGVITVEEEQPGQNTQFIRNLTACITEGIRPNISALLRLIPEGERTVRIEVDEGNHKPYYLKDKGMRPIGVFMRAAGSAVCVNSRQIADMIGTTYGDVYEERRSLHQDLTFSQAAFVFRRNHMSFGPQSYIELGIIDPEDHEFTNLGLILSDQCQHSIRINVYGSTFGHTQQDHTEIGGSVCRQYEEAVAYVMRYAQGHTAYPAEAIQEVLLNAVEHRDYDFTGNIIINIFDYEIEFISMGGLLSDLSVDDIRSGVSESRNRKLAQIFRRMAITSSSAVGIRRVYMIYQGELKRPRIEATENTFKFTLPRLSGAPGSLTQTGTQMESDLPPDAFTSRTRRTAMNRQERHSDMIRQELQQFVQRQTARQMPEIQVKVNEKGGLLSYRKR